MTPLELEYWEAAQKTIAAAFAGGYEGGKADLAAGRAEKTGDDETVFYIDVPRDHIVDGEGPAHAPRFAHAGRRAALARRRDDEARIEVLEGPETKAAHDNRRCRWVVMLNPPPT